MFLKYLINPNVFLPNTISRLVFVYDKAWVNALRIGIITLLCTQRFNFHYQPTHEWVTQWLCDMYWLSVDVIICQDWRSQSGPIRTILRHSQNCIICWNQAFRIKTDHFVGSSVLTFGEFIHPTALFAFDSKRSDPKFYTILKVHGKKPITASSQDHCWRHFYLYVWKHIHLLWFIIVPVSNPQWIVWNVNYSVCFIRRRQLLFWFKAY